MKTVLMALITGLICGSAFALMKLPIPAPPNLTGVMGIIGIFLGYVLVTNFAK